jgi:uncharacterized protein with ParB-like and HNH nuclease domain
MAIQNPEVTTIEKLLSGDVHLSVPRYQRSYAWEEDQVEEFWEDLINASHASNEEYFFGTIVLQLKQGGQVEIIDGQQRLATITMVFSAIRNHYQTASDESRAERINSSYLGGIAFSQDAVLIPKIELNEINNPVWVDYILKSRDLSEVLTEIRSKTVHASNRLLLSAYSYLLKKIGDEVTNYGKKADDFIVKLLDCLRKSVKILSIPVASDEDANLFFESLNARGKDLAISDLLKNRFYFEAKAQVGLAQQLWHNLETNLTQGSLPEYIRHFWIAKKVTSANTTVREKTLYRTVLKEVKSKVKSTITLLEDISKSAIDYSKIGDIRLWPEDPRYETDEFIAAIDDLKTFRVTQCHPLLLNAIQSFKSPKEIAKAFQIVANFSLRYFIVGNQSPGNLERESGTIALEIRNGNIKNAAQLAQSFISLNPDKIFKSNFQDISIYRAKTARLILQRINNYMVKSKSRSGAELIANPNARTVNLEHILPQGASTSWTNEFSNKREAEEYVHRLGNLTLLTVKINNEIANKSFKDKKNIAFVPSKLEINRFVAASKRWSHKEIENRQNEMADLALKIWPLS